MRYTNFTRLLKRFDESGWNGRFREGRWEIASGGYDCVFIIYYDNFPIVECIVDTVAIITSEVSKEDAHKLYSKILKVWPDLRIKC